MMVHEENFLVKGNERKKGREVQPNGRAGVH